jgi:hypothetical protein
MLCNLLANFLFSDKNDLIAAHDKRTAYQATNGSRPENCNPHHHYGAARRSSGSH